MTKVKVCGIQEASHALVAAQAGADFIGLVFVPGVRRMLREEKACSIVSALRNSVENPPKVVGLFADQPLADVNRIIRYCGLDMAQLCGSESLAYCAQVAAPVIKVLHVGDSLSVEEAATYLSKTITILEQNGHLVTLDRRAEGVPGGAGQAFNWEIAKAVSQLGLHFLLAGGLTPDNVGRAVEEVRPWGVDVSSGVETNGIKDVGKIKTFITTVRSILL